MTLATVQPLGLFSRIVRKSKKIVRPIYHRIFGKGINRFLNSSDMHGSIALGKTADTVSRHGIIELPVTVHNSSRTKWLGFGSKPVQLLVEWKNRRGEPLPDQPRYEYPWEGAIEAGQSATMNVVFHGLLSLGEFQIEVGLGQTFANRFEVRPATTNVTVDEGASELDYHAHFASFDLNKDYWTVVGPTSEPEYHRLAKVKRQHLIDIGLTPDAKILDVGCGTGQLASAMVDYLSDRGEYWGGELAFPGVEWCKKKYTRPNFHFFQNTMTTIPISGKQFDFITYFSVFTHTYPDENRELLKESKRLLAPKGCIFADFFTSPLVSNYLGNRGALENNRDKLMAMIKEIGLKAEEVFTSPWYAYGTRRFLKLTHA